MAYSHGIENTESPTSIAAPLTVSSGIPVFVGTSPVNMVGANAAVNKPILVNRYEDAVAQLGYSTDFKNYTLSGAIFAMFKFFNVAPVIFINVLDPNNSAHVKAVEESTKTSEAYKIILDEEGIISSSIVIKSGENTLNIGTDYEITYNAVGRCIISLVEASEYYSSESFNIAYSKLAPESVTDNDIVGVYDDSTGAETGLHLVRRVLPMFGVIPGLLCAPKYGAHAIVAAKLQSLCDSMPGKHKCDAVIDVDASVAKKYTDVKDEKNKAGIISPHAVAVWPMAKVGDNIIHLSSLITAHMAYSDAQAGDIPTNPSNKQINISAIVDDDGNEIFLDMDQGNELNAQGVLTVINFLGFRTWGNNTAAYPNNTDPKDRWIYCRRYFTWRANNLMRNYFSKVDDPTNFRLVESVVDSENIVGNSHVAAGMAATDRIEYRTSDNPIEQILNGKVKFKLYLAPYTPAETICFDLEFDPNAISAALAGGEA